MLAAELPCILIQPHNQFNTVKNNKNVSNLTDTSNLMEALKAHFLTFSTKQNQIFLFRSRRHVYNSTRVVTARPRMLCRTYTREMHCGIETRWRTVNKTIVKLALHLSVFWCGKRTEKLGKQSIGDCRVFDFSYMLHFYSWETEFRFRDFSSTVTTRYR